MKKLVSIGLLWLTITSCYSQDTLIHKYINDANLFTYVDLQYGYGVLGHHVGTSFTTKYKFNLFTLSYAQNFNASRINKLNEALLMYGFSRRMKNTIFNISAGIGYNWGDVENDEKCTDADSLVCDISPSVHFSGPSFPVKVGFTFTPKKVKHILGWGFHGYTNINGQKPYALGGVHISIGKVSPKLSEAQSQNSGYYQP